MLPKNRVPAISIKRRHKNKKSSSFITALVNNSIIGLLTVLSLAITAGLLYGGYLYTNITNDLPSISNLELLMKPPNAYLLQPTQIFDRTGAILLHELKNPVTSKSNYLFLENIPDHLVNAFIVAKDPQFQTHYGFNINGPTTLATNLVEDLLLWDEEPNSQFYIWRKNLLAVQATTEFGKDQILEWYLNYAEFGDYVHGIDQASWYYFGKSAVNVTLSEAAILAAISQVPNINPGISPEIIVSLQSQVLQDMIYLEMITEDEGLTANNSPINIQSNEPTKEYSNKEFIDLVIEQLNTQFGEDRVSYGGLIIISTLDFKLQIDTTCIAEIQVKRLLGTLPLEASENLNCESARLLPSLNPSEILNTKNITSSVAIMNPSNGQILSLVGPAQEGFSPGTIISPFVYLTGFTRGMGPATMVWDIPSNMPNNIVFEDLNPLDFYGPLRIRQALILDRIATTSQIMSQVGPANVINILQQSGFNNLEIPNTAPTSNLLINSGKIKLLDAVHAYSMFSNQGTLAGYPLNNNDFQNSFSPTTLLLVSDPSGRILLDWTQPQIRPVINAQMAYLITDVLSDELTRREFFGHPNTLETGIPAAVKPGQTFGSQQTWVIGYSTQRVIGVHIGYDHFETQDVLPPIPISVTEELWQVLFKNIHFDLSRIDFEEPIGMSHLNVCDPSGLLPTKECYKIVQEIFLPGNEPILYDNLYQSFSINSETGSLATVFTPPGLVEQKIYIIIPPEAQDWAQAKNIDTPPTIYDSIIAIDNTSESVEITQPEIFSYVSGLVSITGAATGNDFEFFKVQVGEGLNPKEWLQLNEDKYQKVTNGKLAEWDTNGLNGLYAIQVLRINKDQSIETATIQITIDNTPPDIQIVSPKEKGIIKLGNNNVISIQANVTDNLGLFQVDFYIDNKKITSLSTPPFFLLIDIKPGEHSLDIIATDLAGNESQQTILFSISD